MGHGPSTADHQPPTTQHILMHQIPPIVGILLQNEQFSDYPPKNEEILSLVKVRVVSLNKVYPTKS